MTAGDVLVRWSSETLRWHCSGRLDQIMVVGALAHKPLISVQKEAKEV